MVGVRGIVDRATRSATRRARQRRRLHPPRDPRPSPRAARRVRAFLIAAATERLRVGTFVFNNDLRHPAVLAQELATLDVLSGGRVIVGIGAGWNRREYDAIGLPFDVVGIRADRLAESMVVLKALFGDGPATHHGTHYTIDGLDGQPKPVQRPHPPFLIGGTREDVVRLAARERPDRRARPAPGPRLIPRCVPSQDGPPRSAGSGTRPATLFRGWS